MARRLRSYQTSLMKAKDNRVNVSNEVLSGIRLIKLYAWEGDFLTRISGLRTAELKHLMACASARPRLRVCDHS
jgi:ATP-binding cassette subfamily C (CFTR/MRP) protein 1